MDSVKIFKYIITINLAIVVLFVIFLFGMKFFGRVSLDNISAENKDLEKIEMNELQNITDNDGMDTVRKKTIDEEIEEIIQNAIDVDDCKKISDPMYIVICQREFIKNINK